MYISLWILIPVATLVVLGCRESWQNISKIDQLTDGLATLRFRVKELQDQGKDDDEAIWRYRDCLRCLSHQAIDIQSQARNSGDDAGEQIAARFYTLIDKTGDYSRDPETIPALWGEGKP